MARHREHYGPMALQREFGGTFVPLSRGRGMLSADNTLDFFPEIREEEEEVSGGDPERRFVEPKDLEGGSYDPLHEEGENRFSSIEDFLSAPGGEKKVLQTLVENPQLLSAAYVLAEGDPDVEEPLYGLLNILPEAARRAAKRFGKEVVIGRLLSEEDGQAASALHQLQRAARLELVRQRENPRERANACGILGELGYSLKDIEKGRLHPKAA